MVPTAKYQPAIKRTEVASPRGLMRLPPAENRTVIEPLARGLSILHAFTEDRWLGNKEIARRAQLPNATANRLIKTLTELG